jgi:hypothetical protein
VFTEQIERLAAGLGPTGALVIFPEGANWTPGRWRRGIRRLEHSGLPDLAAKAKQMPNLLPPRAGERWPPSLGVAVFSTIFTIRFASYLPANLRNISPVPTAATWTGTR